MQNYFLSAVAVLHLMQMRTCQTSLQVIDRISLRSADCDNLPVLQTSISTY